MKINALNEINRNLDMINDVYRAIRRAFTDDWTPTTIGTIYRQTSPLIYIYLYTCATYTTP